MTESHDAIPEELLARFVPMSALAGTYLKELAQHARFLDLSPGQNVTGALSSVESTVYLVEGALRFSGAGQPDTFLRAREPEARFAIQGAENAGRVAEAIEPSRLLRVERAKISTLLIWAEASARPQSRDERRLRQDVITLLLHSRLFQRIPPGNIERIGEVLEPVHLKVGDTVLRQGESGDYYYIVEEGRCEVLHEIGDDAEPVRLAILEPGESFGEEALLTDSLRNATIRMQTDGVVLRLSREYFVELISDPLVTEVTHQRGEDLVAIGAKWVDVRLREEFERDGLEGALNIPLGELRERAAELPADGSYVTYCNTGRRAQAGAFLMSQRGMHVACLRGGIAVKRPARRGADATADSLPSLRTALLEVDAELDRALREKAEADAARDVEQRLLKPSQAESEAAERLHALTERSDRATTILRASMERKRELEARVREVEAAELSRRRAAEAQCERLRQEAERRLEAEKLRLSRRYQEASGRLQAIEQARREAERRFEEERARMERELEEARARMEAEAARIRESMDAERREAESRAHGIRSDYVTQEQRLRKQTEESLRQERGRLEQEFAVSIAAQEKARQELELAESERVEAERETERLRRAAQAELSRQREQEKAARDAHVENLRVQSSKARERLDMAQQRRDAALRKKEDYSRTLAQDAEAATPAREAEMREELTVFERALASADSAVARAQQAHDSAAQAQAIAEQTAVEAEERADELRLKLYEEMQEWVSEEEDRSQQELEAAAHYASQLERIQAEKEAKRALEARATQSMFSDIQDMLEGRIGDDASLALMRSRMEAEEKARLVQRARKEAAEQLRRARAAAAGKSESE